MENCKKAKPDIKQLLDSTESISKSLYKEPSENSKTYGLESHFNENVDFYKDVTIHGKLNFDFTKIDILVAENLVVPGISSFFGPADFYDNVYVDKSINTGILTARTKLDVGCGGTTLVADANTGKIGIGITDPREKLDVIGDTIISGKVGIGTSIPQQKLDVAGSVKIDETIYDSKNVPGKNGYQLVRDLGGLRWIPLIAEPVAGVPGIATDGIFILDEGVPLYPS